MKDAKRSQMECCRPSNDVSPLEGVEYCLKQLYADKEHRCLDELSPDLTYEEVIGTLLQARDILTTGEVLKKRGRKYFHGTLISFLDYDGTVVSGPFKNK